MVCINHLARRALRGRGNFFFFFKGTRGEKEKKKIGREGSGATPVYK